MSRFPEIVDNIILKHKEHTYGRIYVVSAYAGITNDLLEHKKTNQPGIYQLFENQQNYPIKMIRLQESLYKLNETFSDAGLDVEEANDFIGDRIDQSIIFCAVWIMFWPRAMSAVKSSCWQPENF